MNDEVKNFRVNQELVDRIKTNHGLRGKIERALGVTRYSMYNYLRYNTDALTKYDSLYLISKEYNTPIEEILVEVKTQNI